MTRPTLVFARLATLAACSRSDKPAASNEAATQAPATAAAPALSPLDAAIAGSWRDPANAARDRWRHPAQTLRFFGVTPQQNETVLTPEFGSASSRGRACPDV